MPLAGQAGVEDGRGERGLLPVAVPFPVWSGLPGPLEREIALGPATTWTLKDHTGGSVLALQGCVFKRAWRTTANAVDVFDHDCRDHHATSSIPSSVVRLLIVP